MRICQCRCSVLHVFIAKVHNSCLLTIDEPLKAITTPLVHWHWESKVKKRVKIGCVVRMNVVINNVVM